MTDDQGAGVVYTVWSGWQGSDCGIEPHSYTREADAQKRVDWLEGQGFNAKVVPEMSENGPDKSLGWSKEDDVLPPEEQARYREAAKAAWREMWVEPTPIET